jgi:L-ascorbate metabolism protein UlaG (beta-lactamase superfamily)
MDITYLGQGSVRLSTRGLTVVFDPHTGTKVSGEVVLVSSPEVTIERSGARMVIETPGEFEVGGSLIVGVPVRLHIDEAGERGTAYLVSTEGIRTLVLGNVAPELSGDQLEALGKVDVLIIPVGGHGLTLDSDAAATLVGQLEPKYVIPVHYEDGISKYALPQDGIDVFLGVIGQHPEPVLKLKVTEKDLPLETTYVVLSR